MIAALPRTHPGSHGPLLLQLTRCSALHQVQNLSGCVLHAAVTSRQQQHSPSSYASSCAQVHVWQGLHVQQAIMYKS
jgi:hypothetical protein